VQNLRVAVDVGGTFTDICIMDEATGVIRIEKTSSTRDPIDGIMGGVSKAGIDLSKVALFSHGTTVATNALITRRLPRAAVVTTNGFRDVIEIRRANKEDLWDTYKDVVKPYVPRRDRLTVPERVDASGRVIEPLDVAAAREVARILKRRGVAAIAVCFMNAYLNGENERAMRDIRGNQISMVFQEPMTSLNPVFSVQYQIGESVQLHQHLRGKAKLDKVIESLLRVGVPSPEVRMKDYPHQFSGGMRQRVVGAIAITCRPKLLIADEATTAMAMPAAAIALPRTAVRGPRTFIRP